MADDDPLQGADLTPDERDRLDRFAAAFDRLSAGEYPMFAVEGDDDETRGAVRAAGAVLGTGARGAAVRAAVAAFSDAATQAYDRRLNVPNAFMLYQVLPGQPRDRVRFFASLERAVVGIILWDGIEEEHLGALLGPWAEMVDHAGIE